MERMSRLPGRSIKYFGWTIQRHQLWLTEDYLLSREITLFQEVVRRYYYRDIEAVVSGPTTSWQTCNWITGLLLAFLALCAIAAMLTGSPVALVLAFIMAVVPLAIFSGNLILGPTCKTTLYTAATEAPLHSLGRQRSTEQAITRLLPFVEAAQRDQYATPAGIPEAETPAVEMPAAGPATPPPGPDPSGP